MAMAFAAENTLGKLAKWLRILGFDTLFDSGAGGLEFFRTVSPDRLLLTRTGSVGIHLRSDRLLFIRANEPRQQLIEVIRRLDIGLADIAPFTRCVECNQRIEAVQKRRIRDKVPDFVYESHENFQQCPRCRKIFWQGSHANRVMEHIRQLFDAVRQPPDETVSPV